MSSVPAAPLRRLRAAVRRRSRNTTGRALVVGWFSLPFGGGTAGDLAALEVVRSWLTDAGWACDVALGEPFEGGVSWQAVTPNDYSHVIHVCGPVGPELEVSKLLERFRDCRLVAVNVSLPGGPSDASAFADVIARDGSGAARADLAFAAGETLVPVVGVVLVHPQLEYPDGRHADADAAVRELLAARECATVPIDTRLDFNPGGLRSAAEVESLLARMDVVVTTRLHGLVFALRAGVPALAIDPVAGGAKVSAQAAAVGWPAVLQADDLDPGRLVELFDWCLGEEARALARDCAAQGRAEAERVRRELLGVLGEP